MDAGLMIRWGSVNPGREAPARALFDEAVTYYVGLLEAGKLTSFEPFLCETSDLEDQQGFFILKGPVAEIFAMIETDEYKDILTKATFMLRHVSVSVLTVGDAVAEQLERFEKTRVALQL